MTGSESIEEFYQSKLNKSAGELPQNMGHFNVFRMEDCVGHGKTPIQYSRRDFYKISLLRGRNIYHYADKSIEISGSTLMFFNPQVPYTMEVLSDELSGYFCIFKESFFAENLRSNINQLPVFAVGSKPTYVLNEEQDRHADHIFNKILAEIGSNYMFKYDLIRNYVTELIHFALKMQPSELIYKHADASTRITRVFSELLERQFPIESPSQKFNMRSAKDFADKLSVHVNHLNRAIKETTGKTTTYHISERLTTEAKALLRHTNWNISEISYCLGFEEPAHFNNFFKKHARVTPSAYRAV